METRVYSDLALHGALVMSKNEVGFPSNPALGTMIIKDYCLYAYIKLGTMETWFPFSKATNSYVHVQSSASMTWTVQHNLGTSDIWYQVTGPTGNIIIVGKTDIDEDSFQLDFTSAVVGRCVVVAPDTINVPEVKASIINIANNAVIINSSGVLINGSYALTEANIAQQISDAIALKDNTDEITEGTTNLYFTNTRARAAISVTDNGGDGSVSYDNTTGVITYTGPSSTEVRAHFSQGTGIQVSSGQISVDNTIATVSALNTEITRATNAESTLTANLNSEITRATNAEATISANVLVEKTRATNAESTLTTNLNTEITRATNAEATISANVLVEKTRALAAETTLTTNLNAEISRAQAAEASIAASVLAIGSAFNYVGTVSGGASSGAAYDLTALAQKDAGDYYKVAVSGYFKVGTGGTPFYANVNDGLVWNLSNSVDLIDNTNASISGTSNEISVTGSTDAGYTIALSSAFSGRMTTAESNINTEITRATNAESTLTANVLVEKTRALAAEATLTTNLNAEITRATNAESTLTANLNTEVTRATNAESTLTANLNTEITRATNAESTISANVLVEKTRALAAEASLSAALAAEISRAQAAETSLTSSLISGGTF